MHLDLDDRTLFIGVGAAKCGTTWLSERLDEHPEVFMSPVKEMHWFDGPTSRRHFQRSLARKVRRHTQPSRVDNDIDEETSALLHRLSLRNDADYLLYFASRLDPSHRAFGEFSPSYALVDADTFARMHDLHSRVRFIFLMRNPTDRLWSQFKYRFQLHKEPVPEHFDLSLVADAELAQMISRGDYAHTLRELWKAVPREHVFTAFYEDIFSPQRSNDVLGSLWQFLGVDRAGTLARLNARAHLMRRVNATPSSPLPDDEREMIVSMLADTYRFAAEELSGLPESWVHDLELLG
jgi:hypothetical protein